VSSCSPCVRHADPARRHSHASPCSRGRRCEVFEIKRLGYSAQTLAEEERNAASIVKFAEKSAREEEKAKRKRLREEEAEKVAAQEEKEADGQADEKEEEKDDAGVHMKRPPPAMKKRPPPALPSATAAPTAS
jgi:hypothetical protein